MRQTGIEVERALAVLGLAAMFFSFLHLHEQFLNMLMRFVDLACEVRKIGMQVDFGARDRPMARIAAHIQEIHPTFLDWSRASNGASCAALAGESESHH